jgi:hypothetical protein
MRRAASMLAFLIFLLVAVRAEAPYVPVWNAQLYNSLIELQTLITPGRIQKMKVKADLIFLEFWEILNEKP